MFSRRSVALQLPVTGFGREGRPSCFHLLILGPGLAVDRGYVFSDSYFTLKRGHQTLPVVFRRTTVSLRYVLNNTGPSETETVLTPSGREGGARDV